MWMKTALSIPSLIINCSFATYDGHKGTDIIIPTFWYMDEMTTPVLAAANGNVVYTHDGEFDRQLDLDSTAVANLVLVEYDAGIYGLYGHLKKNVKNSFTVAVHYY